MSQVSLAQKARWMLAVIIWSIFIPLLWSEPVMVQAQPVEPPLQLSRSQAQPTGYQEYYVLGYEEQVWRAFLAIYDGLDTDIPGQICSVVSLVATTDHQVIYYDHWEDGYEVDLFHPTQMDTTKIYGDHNPDNGGTGDDILHAGDIITLTSTQELTGTMTFTATVTVSPAREPNDRRYDGGDRVVSIGGPVSLSHAMWPFSNSWAGGAWTMYSRQAYQDAYSYRLPIGENLYDSDSARYGDFEKVYLQLEAFEDNTAISIDNGSRTVNLTLNRGQTYSSIGYISSTNAPSLIINAGTTIQASGPVQVGLITGANSPSNKFQGRFLVVLPDHMLGSDYVVPAPGKDSHWAEIYVSNPNRFPIRVDAFGLDGSNNVIQTPLFISPAGQISATVPYSFTRDGHVAENSAVRFTSLDGVFAVVVCADTTGTAFEWGFSAIPSRYLAQDYYVPWAPGNSCNPPSDPDCDGGNAANGSSVWVTPLSDKTTFYIDFDPAVDDTVDYSFTLDVLQQKWISDTLDKDNTGMHIWATGKFAVVWGEDPHTAKEGSHYLDMGYTIMPTYKDWIDPVFTLDVTAAPNILPLAGGVATFTLVASAYYTLTDVDITHTLPVSWAYRPGEAYVTYPDNLTQPVSPIINGTTLFWDTSTALNPNQSLTLTFQAKITETAGVTISMHQSKAAGKAIDSNTWFAPGDSSIIYISPLLVEKTMSPDQAKPGDILTCTVSCKNIGSTFVHNITLYDILPAAHVVTHDLDSGTYQTASETISWPEISQLGEGGSSGDMRPRVKVREFVPDGTVIENQACLTSDEMDWVCSTPARTVAVAPKLTLTQSGPTVAMPGQTVVYTFTYQNAGHYMATSTVITNVLPISITYVTGSLEIYTGTQWVALTDDGDKDQGKYTSTVSPTLVITPGRVAGSIGIGEKGQIRFHAQIADTAPADSVILNDALFDHSLDQPRHSNLAMTRILGLMIAKTAQQTNTLPGGMITYTIAYSNASSTLTQTDVCVQDDIPAHTFLSASTSPAGVVTWYSTDGATYSTTMPPAEQVRHIRWCTSSLTKTLQTIELVVRASDILPAGASIWNTATISSTQSDMYKGEPIPSKPVEVKTAVLEIAKSANPQDNVEPGERITYTIAYTNVGTADIPVAVIVDNLPMHVTLITPTITGGGQAGGGAITWTAPITHQEAGLSVTFAVSVDRFLPVGADVINNLVTATVSNVVMVTKTTVRVDADPDLEITKLVGVADVRQGQSFTYTIVVTNKGYQDAGGVIITDTVPEHLGIVGYADGCSHSGNLVTCAVGLLAAQHLETRTLTVTLDTEPEQDILSNVVTVTGQDGEGTTFSATATAAVHVTMMPSLTVTKTAQPDPVAAGMPLTYTLVVSNIGRGDAHSVTVSDTLPANASLAGFEPHDLCAFVEASSALTCHIPTLASGAQIPITYTVLVTRPLEDGTRITNTVSVTCTEVPTLVVGKAINTAYTPILTLSKSAAGTVAGCPVTYTIVVTNESIFGGATGIVVTDILPVSATFITGGVKVGNAVSLTVSQIGANRSASVTLVVSSCQATLTNTHYRVITSTEGVDSLPGAELVYTQPAPEIAPGFIYTPTAPNVNEAVTFTSSHTTDGTPIVEWTWDFGDNHTASGPMTTHQYAASGMYVVTLRITDACGHTESATNSIDVGIPVLTVAKQAQSAVRAGERLIYTIVITNSGSANATGVVVSDTLPDHVSFVSGSIQIDPPGWGMTKTNPSISVNNGTITAGRQVTLVYAVMVDRPLSVGTKITNTVSVTSTQTPIPTTSSVHSTVTNASPYFTSMPIMTATQGQSYTYFVTTTDPDWVYGDRLAITALIKPSWLTLTDKGDGTAVLSGTPNNADVGNHQIIVQVCDNSGATDRQYFYIAVDDANDKPYFTSKPLETVEWGKPYVYAITAADPDLIYDDQLYIAASIPLPSWLTLILTGNGMALLTGTPTIRDAGWNYSIGLQAHDRAGAAASQNFTITVTGLVHRLFLPLALENYTYCSDDFSNPDSKWLVGDYPEAKYSYVAGEYSIYAKQRYIVSPSPCGSFDKYSAEVEAKWMGPGTIEEYGVFLGIRQQEFKGFTATLYSRFVVATIDGQLKYSLRAYTVTEAGNLDWIPIVDWTENEYINQGAVPNTFKVEYDRNMLIIYLNDHRLWKGSLFCSGGIGLTSSADSSYTEARFDNFWVEGHRQNEKKDSGTSFRVLVPEE